MEWAERERERAKRKKKKERAGEERFSSERES